MKATEITEKIIANLEAKGFEDVLIDDVPHVTEYPWGERRTTYQPFALAQTRGQGLMLVKRELLGWDGDGYAHVRMDLPSAPRKVREAAEGFLARMRGRGLI